LFEVLSIPGAIIDPRLHVVICAKHSKVREGSEIFGF